ncbi:hypothetical protein OIU78_015058 [Salix suchowensis]|nr:hypothetical protein OIU78_015058 [Salix suchowensis]
MLQQTLVAEIAEKVELEGMTEDYGKLEKELEKAFPLAIINKALQKFIDGSAISFRCVLIRCHDCVCRVINIQMNIFNADIYIHKLSKIQEI